MKIGLKYYVRFFICSAFFIGVALGRARSSKRTSVERGRIPRPLLNQQCQSTASEDSTATVLPRHPRFGGEIAGIGGIY